MHTNDNVRDGYVKDSPENEKDESKTKTNHSGDLLLPPAEAEKMVEVICKQCQVELKSRIFESLFKAI